MPANFKKKKKNKATFLVGGALVALFLLLFLFAGFPPAFLKKGVLFLLRPVVLLENKINRGLNFVILPLKEKSTLVKENNLLRQKLAEFDVAEDYWAVIKNENLELRRVLENKKENERLIKAAVLLRPGYGVYNSLVIDAGSNNGIEKGMIATAFNQVLLGYVSEVSPRVSTIKLISYPKEETNVFVGGKVAAIAIGKGAENMQIELPAGVNIEVGDEVVSLGSNPLLLGIVERVEKAPVSPFQKIFFRLSANVQELHYIYLRK